ncbi:hypothetical protein WCLP8_5020003 [uncultured Gammaproteobacteria bacterium]
MVVVSLTFAIERGLGVIFHYY